MSQDSPTCEVCGKPAQEGNRLKAGAHLAYCYQWRRRNDPSRPECSTDGCTNKAQGSSGLCNRCDQRRTRTARGATKSARGLYESNKGLKCSTSWCDKDATSKGRCMVCAAWHRDGRDPETRRYAYNRTPEDIMALVMSIEPDPVTGCRDGSGVFSINTHGYSTASVGGQVVTVSRLVVSHSLGHSIGRYNHACHTCDNPPCVEPAHLWEGTPAQNMADRDMKGRQVKGSRNWTSKLTEDDVRQIRAEYNRNSVELADRYGVTHATILKVVARKSWRHVE